MPRVFLFNITRRELQFWDEPNPPRYTWETASRYVPKWTRDETIACNVYNSPSSSDLYLISGHRDETLRGNYNDSGDLTSLEFSLHYHRNKLHVLDFTILPKLPETVAPGCPQ